MSKRGMDFLNLWVQANVHAGGNAGKLAISCAADALMGGLSLEEIEEEAGPLQAVIADALAHIADGGDVITETDD